MEHQLLLLAHHPGIVGTVASIYLVLCLGTRMVARGAGAFLDALIERGPRLIELGNGGLDLLERFLEILHRYRRR